MPRPALTNELLSQSVSVDGPADAPALVLVHGVHLGRYSWQPHVRLLRDRFRVVTLDLPRHGTLFDIPLTQTNIDAQLRYVVDEVLQTRPVFAGYSLGGYAVAQFSRANPQRSRALLLAGSSLDLTAWRHATYSSLMRVQAMIPVRVFEITSHAFFRATLKGELAEAIIGNPFNRCAIRESYEMLKGREFSTMLEGYPNPVLIVNGEWDVLFRPQSKRFAGAPLAQTLLVRGGDHVFPLRRPEEFCAILSDFASATLRRPLVPR